jgi:hypothetical protein
MSSNRANGTPASSSWRSALPIHPAAELSPRMSPDELRALGEDIVKSGLKSPIVLWRRDSRSLPSLLDGIQVRQEIAPCHDPKGLAYPSATYSPSARKSEFRKLANAGANRG